MVEVLPKLLKQRIAIRLRNGSVRGVYMASGRNLEGDVLAGSRGVWFIHGGIKY